MAADGYSSGALCWVVSSIHVFATSSAAATATKKPRTRGGGTTLLIMMRDQRSSKRHIPGAWECHESAASVNNNGVAGRRRTNPHISEEISEPRPKTKPHTHTNTVIEGPLIRADPYSIAAYANLVNGPYTGLSSSLVHPKRRCRACDWGFSGRSPRRLALTALTSVVTDAF